MSIIFFVIILIYLSYLILIVRFRYNFKKPPRVNPSTNNILPISVIVAVKNGESSLPQLIDCLKNQTYEDFYKILNKHNLKLGFKANIPFLNSDLKKAFNSFEQIYLYYETKMQEKGEI